LKKTQKNWREPENVFQGKWHDVVIIIEYYAAFTGSEAALSAEFRPSVKCHRLTRNWRAVETSNLEERWRWTGVTGRANLTF